MGFQPAAPIKPEFRKPPGEPLAPVKPKFRKPPGFETTEEFWWLLCIFCLPIVIGLAFSIPGETKKMNDSQKVRVTCPYCQTEQEVYLDFKHRTPAQVFICDIEANPGCDMPFVVFGQVNFSATARAIVGYDGKDDRPLPECEHGSYSEDCEECALERLERTRVSGCPHGEPLLSCDVCNHAADLAHDAAREDRVFGRR